MSRGWKAAFSIQALSIAGLVLVFIAGTMAAFQIWAGCVLAVLGYVMILYRRPLAEWLHYANGGPLVLRYGWWPFFPTLEARVAYERVGLLILGGITMLVGSGFLAAGVGELLEL